MDFCILCDGHELQGKSVAVLGDDVFAARTALDLVHFEPKSVEMLTRGGEFLGDAKEPERAELERQLTDASITRFDADITGFDGIREKQFHVKLVDGSVRKYDRGFSALGWYEMNKAIPESLGAGFDEEGYVRTDADSRVIAANNGQPIPGLYCIGDQASGWKQIPEAWATAERAIIHAYAYLL